MIFLLYYWRHTNFNSTLKLIASFLTGHKQCVNNKDILSLFKDSSHEKCQFSQSFSIWSNIDLKVVTLLDISIADLPSTLNFLPFYEVRSKLPRISNLETYNLEDYIVHNM